MKLNRCLIYKVQFPVRLRGFIPGLSRAFRNFLFSSVPVSLFIIPRAAGIVNGFFRFFSSFLRFYGIHPFFPLLSRTWLYMITNVIRTARPQPMTEPVFPAVLPGFCPSNPPPQLRPYWLFSFQSRSSKTDNSLLITSISSGSRQHSTPKTSVTILSGKLNRNRAPPSSRSSNNSLPS